MGWEWKRTLIFKVINLIVFMSLINYENIGSWIRILREHACYKILSCWEQYLPESYYILIIMFQEKSRKEKFRQTAREIYLDKKCLQEGIR